MVMTTPPAVVTMRACRPAAGTLEPMFSLPTVDDSGFPHVCLLSRAELVADNRPVYAVCASRNTIANLCRDGKATRVVVGADIAVYDKLTVSESVPDGDWLGVACQALPQNPCTITTAGLSAMTIAPCRKTTTRAVAYAMRAFNLYGRPITGKTERPRTRVRGLLKRAGTTFRGRGGT